MKNKLYTACILLLIIAICVSIPLYKRSQQLDNWISNRSEYFAKDYLPSVSTMDAYHFLRYVKDENLNKNVPMFSKLLIIGYKFFDSEGFDKTFMGSIKFSNVLAVLFVIPLILYMYFAGAGLSTGIFGALFGSFSMAYYVRSSTGRVDTDGVLMLLPFLLGVLSLFIIKSKRWYIKFALSAIISFGLFKMIPFHAFASGLFGIYLGLIILAMIINREKIYHILGVVAVYCLVVNPTKIFQYFKSTWYYLQKGAVFGNTGILIETVEEAKKGGLEGVVQNITNYDMLFYLGLAGVLLLFLLNFKKMIFLLPMFVLGMFSFKGSIRLSMFLAPFIGIGIGYVIHLGVDYAIKYFKKDEAVLKYLITSTMALLIFFTVKNGTGYAYIPKPSVPVKAIESIIDLKEKLPKGSTIFTWWDLGYPLQTVGGFSVYATGGSAYTKTFNFPLATGFLAGNDDEFYRLASNLFNRGFRDFNSILSKNDEKGIHEILQNYTAPIPKNKNYYVLYTDDLIGKLYSISKFAPLTVKEGQETYYNELKCGKFQDNIMYCDKFNVDMGRGFLLAKETSQQIPLYKISRINNGYEVKKQIYNSMSKYHLTVITKGNTVYKVLLYTNDMANTAFHQQYIEGKPGKMFTEIYNNYPYVRVFRFNPQDSK